MEGKKQKTSLKDTFLCPRKESNLELIFDTNL